MDSIKKINTFIWYHIDQSMEVINIAYT